MNKKGHVQTLVAAHPGNRNAVKSGVFSPATLAPRVHELEGSIAERPVQEVVADLLRRELAALAALGEAMDQSLATDETADCEIVLTTFVDAGAYTGTTTLAALRAGFSSVLACEPEPSNARLLRTNIALNGAEASVRALEVALSDQAGTATLDVGRSGRSKSCLLPGSPNEARGNTVEVRTVLLDDLALDGVFDPAEVGFFWLDVEGYECRVLEGAATVLERSPPLVMELYPKLLRRAGSIASLTGLLAQHYTHVADLRSSDAQLAPVKLVSELIESYDRSKTDLLLCRPPGR